MKVRSESEKLKDLHKKSQESMVQTILLEWRIKQNQKECSLIVSLIQISMIQGMTLNRINLTGKLCKQEI